MALEKGYESGSRGDIGEVNENILSVLDKKSLKKAGLVDDIWPDRVLQRANEDGEWVQVIQREVDQMLYVEVVQVLQPLESQVSANLWRL